MDPHLKKARHHRLAAALRANLRKRKGHPALPAATAADVVVASDRGNTTVVKEDGEEVPKPPPSDRNHRS